MAFMREYSVKSTTREQLIYCPLPIHSMLAEATCERYGVAVNCYCVG